VILLVELRVDLLGMVVVIIQAHTPPSDRLYTAAPCLTHSRFGPELLEILNFNSIINFGDFDRVNVA